jgi:F-type H+-transporting ATPase subunit alpha
MPVSTIRIKELGRVKEVKKNIARVEGLSLFMNGQLVHFASGIKGMIVGFTEGDILVLILGDEAQVRIGEEVYSKVEEFKIPVGEGFLGRVVNALAEPVDGKGPIQSETLENYPVFREAPETMDRGGVSACLETGIKIIDTVVPIAKGQRQLIIGDRMTGKTTIAVDAILNQKGKDVVCIYCCIGKSFSSLIKVVQLLKMKGALDWTIIVAATASTTVGEQYLAPYSACALGEYFMYKGRDVLVVFDDMTKHAWSYRQLSLLLERPPGREAYPGDIYYIHSQLIERAGKLSQELGGGSMAFLPIVDTLQGDVTGFISSNLISMTDGQVYLSSSLFAEGFKPAVDMSMAVSIIGSKIQNPVLKDLAKTLRLEYVQYKELLRLTKLKAGALSDEAERKIHRGEALCAILTQDRNNPVSIEELVVLLYAFNRKILDELDKLKLNRFKNEIWGYIVRNAPYVAEKLKDIKELKPGIKAELDKIFVEYFKGIE